MSLVETRVLKLTIVKFVFVVDKFNSVLSLVIYNDLYLRFQWHVLQIQQNTVLLVTRCFEIHVSYFSSWNIKGCKGFPIFLKVHDDVKRIQMETQYSNYHVIRKETEQTKHAVSRIIHVYSNCMTNGVTVKTKTNSYLGVLCCEL